MLNAMALQRKENKLEETLQENCKVTQEIVDILEGIASRGRKRISLFIDKAGEDGETDTGRV